MGAGSEQFTFNGIDGATGAYLAEPATAVELARRAFGERFTQRPDEQVEARLRDKLRFFHERSTRSRYGPSEGIDPKDLAQAGWGVIFASSDRGGSGAVREALGELLSLRREQAGPRYRELLGEDAYRQGERADDFLARLGVGPGPAQPDKVPYYLLLVGSPEALPYRFQVELDVQYAVGRVHFDTLDEYAAYARSVALAERGQAVRPRRAVLVGTENPGDPATHLSSAQLVSPLFAWMTGWAEKAPGPRWEVQRIAGESATKERLRSLAGGEETPALLFTATHGMGFPKGDPRQAPHQGALLCQDWPGKAAWPKPIPEGFYLSADDVGDDARLLGLIAFHFACFSAGTPLRDAFARASSAPATEIAPCPFVGRLPQRLLGHPRGGALAVVGHVERALGFSFAWPRAGAQAAVYESTLQRLLEGHPVGSALEYFNLRYAELSTKLSDELDDVDNGAVPDPLRLSDLWTANNDARGFALLGDPAVRLPAPASAPAPRLVPEVSSPPPSAARAPADLGDLHAALAARLREILDAEGVEVVTSRADGVRVVTRILRSGDVHTALPGPPIDEATSGHHARMVREAMEQRARLLDALAGALSRLGAPVRPARRR
jgi:hypothetical protein